MFFFFFFKQKTAYEMRISDWSSDVCSSDLPIGADVAGMVDHVRVGIDEQTDAHAHVLEVADDRSKPPGLPGDVPAGVGGAGLRCVRDESGRSDESRVGKEWVRTGKSRWSP